MSGPVAAISVHSTAVVSKEADLGEGVSVGPYAVIEAGAIVGSGTTIGAHAIVTSYAVIGRNCQIHFGAVIGHEPQDLGFDGAPSQAIVGDRSVVREYATIHRATREGGATRIGEQCLVMSHAHVAHDARVGNQVVLCNSCLVAGHVEIGDRAFLSGNTVVHQFCRVGAVVMLSGLSGIGRDVGPFLTVAGRSEVVALNSVGMRRAGLTVEARRRVKDAYRLLFASQTLEVGAARLHEIDEGHAEIAAIVAFYSRTGRGFSRPPTRHALFEDNADQ